MGFEVEKFRLRRLEAPRALARGPPPNHVGEGGPGESELEGLWGSNQRPHPDTGPQPPAESLEMPHERGDD